LGLSSLSHLVDFSLTGKYHKLIDLLIDSSKACLEFSEENAFKICEIILDPPDIFTTENEKRFVDLCDSFSIEKQIHGPFIDVSMCSTNDKISRASVDSYVETVRICEKIGGKLVTIHPGAGNPVLSSIGTYNKKQLIRAVNELLNATANLDVGICIENMPKLTNMLLNERELEDFFSELNRDGLYLTYDTSHLWTNDGDIKILWNKFHTRIRNVHLVENFNKDSDTHPELGTGKIDFQYIFNVMRNYEYDGPMIIEVMNTKSLSRSIEYIGKTLKQ
jgi:sugar phosphate isomerase/epimerase